MFDSYALMQAQEQLKISDDKFPQFLARFKALQDVRRQGMQQRFQRIGALRRALDQAQADEAAIGALLKELDDLETRSQAEIKKAYAALDQLLDVKQQAKFRVFEDVMERRKLELVTRARANRPKL